ncbi:hypothetical protein BEWA_026080 [Theileria equi strain WA]|uniref:Uncharacterized protein n=1 Tax=Theileria equi strain WA TaxID=1537102 RepID=L0AXW6_THEEQ|nr:hypothetical protein BEWA_026080 [Theileria equi strain WA]AFZ79759.1 hypothetical protein BEWA_026080 [Theileria equi strain WA]|eukprot:XP_004829425.1 hypothetical protein BEWA_026080 [Theileria equi strain WA]
MTETRTLTCSKRYVDVNISKTDASRNYTDDCHNNINVSLEASIKNPAGLKGYKRYTHTFGSYYLGGINYNGARQVGIPVSLNTYYNKNVIVYYLGYDDGNLVPLLVKLTKSSTNYEYYTRINPLSTSDQWTDQNFSVDQESKLTEKLPGISSQLTELVVLNLTKTSESYYANGEDKAPDANKDTQITVEGSEYEKVYKEVIHTPRRSQIRLLSTKGANSKNIPFEDSNVYTTPYNSAHVYFWEGDSGHIKPLLLGLESSESHTYFKLTKDCSKWEINNSAISDLKGELDKQNCYKNKAHVIDISKNSGTSSYQCLTTGCTVSITFVNHPYTYYSRTLHSVFDDSIRRFKNKEAEQTGINSPEGTNQVYVFLSPSGSNGIPLLIHYSSSWYQRTSLDLAEWTEVQGPDKPGSVFEQTKILTLLKAKLPIVTINVGYTNGLSRNGDPGTYPDPSGDGEKEQIKVEREDINGGFVSFIHSVQDKPFVARDVKYNTTFLQGISSSFILNSVTAYYSVQGSDLSLDDLLMIGLEKRNGPNKYSYYGRRNGGSNWTTIPRQTEKLGSLLTTKLGQLKDQVYAEKNKSSQGKASGLPPAVKNALAGTAGTLITVGTVVGLVKKFWGTIVTTLITSM